MDIIHAMVVLSEQPPTETVASSKDFEYHIILLLGSSCTSIQRFIVVELLTLSFFLAPTMFVLFVTVLISLK